MHQKVEDEDREEGNMIEQRLWVQKLVFERGGQEGTTSALDQVEAGQVREYSSWECDGSNGSAKVKLAGAVFKRGSDGVEGEGIAIESIRPRHRPRNYVDNLHREP
jgi:hypothetical protein